MPNKTLIDAVSTAANRAAMLGNLVENYYDDSETKLLQGVNDLVEDLRVLKGLSEESTLLVPPRLLTLLDENESPDTYTGERLKQCKAVREASALKQQAISAARKLLSEKE